MRDIPNFEKLYAATEDGRIWSYRRKKFLTNCGEADNYQVVTLTVDGVHRTFYVHRLIAQAFLPNPNNLPQVNHIDENKSNNNVSNLEWCTAKYNCNFGTIQARRKYNKQLKESF